MSRHNILIGAFEAPTVSLITNVGYPGGRIAPDPGLKFLVVVVELAEGSKKMLLSEQGDLLLADGRAYPALGISSGSIMCQALDTFVGDRPAGMEIEGESHGYRYAILFAVPRDVEAAEVDLSGLSGTRLNWIAELPDDLGTTGEGVKMRFLESMSLPHALPFGHHDEQLASLVRHEVPIDECGILAQGVVDGVGVVFARVALGDDVRSRIEIDTIVGRLDDGSTVECLGSIEWATFLKDEPNGPVSMLGVARKFDSIEVVGEVSDIRLTKLTSYGGPTTQVLDLEIKLALQFREDVVGRLEAICVGGRWLVGAGTGWVDERIVGSDGDTPSPLAEPHSSNRAAPGVSKRPREIAGGNLTTIIIAFLRDRVAHSVEVGGEALFSRNVMRPSPESLVGTGIKLDMRGVSVVNLDEFGSCLLQQSLVMQDELRGHTEFFNDEAQQIIGGLIKALIQVGTRAEKGAEVSMSSVVVSSAV